MNARWCNLVPILLLAIAVPAAAAGFGRNKVRLDGTRWLVLTTPHFDLTYPDGAEELAVQAAIIAERAYREYADRLDHELSRRVPFILYKSHAAFAGTNISDALIGEGTGGFTEPYRNRMVLPYDGSFADFVHVVRHELVHVFMFDTLYGSSREQGMRSRFFQVPLWFAEGIAEWWSRGWDAEADMYMRDAITAGYLPPLERSGGFLVYKQGQAALRLLSERYGERKIVELWSLLARTRSMRRALDGALGLRMKDLDRLLEEDLRRRYWPAYADLERPTEISRPVTDHLEQKIGFSRRPAISPDGTRIACYTDRDGLPSLYLLSALDGRVLRRLAEGHRRDRFETLHAFRSGATWSPDGREVALIARSDNVETLHTVRADDGKVTRSLRLGLDTARQPAWSPDGRAIVLVGVANGRTDLYLLDLGGAAVPPGSVRVRELDDGVLLWRLTDTAADEATPAWSPDGARLLWREDPRAAVAFEFVERDGERRLSWARFVRPDSCLADTLQQGRFVVLTLADGRRNELAGTGGDWRDPVWTGPASLCVVESGLGPQNLAVVELDSAATRVVAWRRVTGVAGGMFDPSFSPAADRLACAVFRQGSWDVVCIDDFHRWSRREPDGRPPRRFVQGPPPVPATRREGPVRIRDRQRVGTVGPYHPHLSFDVNDAFGGGAVSFAPQVGLGLANIVNLSDDLGDHRLSMLLNVYGSLSNSDVAVSYANLKHRWNVGGGLFHFRNYYNSVFTTVGEVLPHDTFFSERNYGLYGFAEYPLSTFRRFGFETRALVSERTDYVLDATGRYLVADRQRTDHLLELSADYVVDTAYYGPFGPVTGHRLLLQYTPSLPVGNALERRTLVVDLRQYWLLWRRDTLAARLLVASSDGPHPRAFVLGGPYTLRSYGFWDYQRTTHLAGPHVVMFNLEYRLPLLAGLVFDWPTRWAFGPVGTTLFWDMGAAWTDTFQPFGSDDSGRWGFRDLRGGYGIGIRMRIAFLPLRFDWARRTDLRNAGRGEFHFSIGSEF